MATGKLSSVFHVNQIPAQDSETGIPGKASVILTNMMITPASLAKAGNESCMSENQIMESYLRQ